MTLVEHFWKRFASEAECIQEISTPTLLAITYGLEDPLGPTADQKATLAAPVEKCSMTTLPSLEEGVWWFRLI
jgi:hypothetical protein